MATIKSFTDLEQSKKLAEILPIESADTIWDLTNPDLSIIRAIPYEDSDYNNKYLNIIPAWSLAALLDYLKSKNKFPEIKELSDGRFKLATYIWDGKDCIQVSIEDSIVDACCELILKLNELKLL